MLSLRGKVVTADAMRCQRQMAERVIEQGGDYALVHHRRKRQSGYAPRVIAYKITALSLLLSQESRACNVSGFRNAITA